MSDALEEEPPPIPASLLPPGMGLMMTVPLDSLVPDDRNARTHGDKNMAAIMGCLVTFGQVEPLVVGKGRRVLGGNARLEVMRQLGWDTARVVEVNLPDDEEQALALALNRTSELAGWDPSRLAEQTEALADAGFDLGKIGWSDQDLSQIWSSDWKPEETKSDDSPEETNQRTHSIRLTLEQREVFNRAAFKVREQTGDQEMTDGRALELIAADFLAGQ